MVVMRKCNAPEEFAFVPLHKEKKFLEPRELIPPDNRTAHTQVLYNILITHIFDTQFIFNE